MLQKAATIAKICLLFAWAVLPCAISWQVVYGPAHFRGYLDEKLGPVNTWAAETGKSTTALIQKANNFADDNFEATISTTRATAATVRHLDTFVVDLNANVNGGEDSEGAVKAGLILDVHNTLVQTQTTIASAQSDVHLLMESGATAVAKLDPLLGSLASLTETMEKELKEGSPHVTSTIDELKVGLVNLNALLAGDDMKGIFKNVNTTTYHLGESAKSVDFAFQSLRTKMGLIKTLLTKAYNLIKITVPLP